jgi:hypothetical protein
MEQERCYRRPGWRGGSWAGVEGQAAFVVDARSPHVLLHQAVEHAACVGVSPINKEGTDRLSFIAQLPELGLAPDRLPARPDEPSIGVGTRAQLVGVAEQNRGVAELLDHQQLVGCRGVRHG